jgi:hypothetical protein
LADTLRQVDIWSVTLFITIFTVELYNYCVYKFTVELYNYCVYKFTVELYNYYVYIFTCVSDDCQEKHLFTKTRVIEKIGNFSDYNLINKIK